jgi:serine protease Do
MPQPLRRAAGAADSALPRRWFSCFFAIDASNLDEAAPAFHHGNRLRLEMIWNKRAIVRRFVCVTMGSIQCLAIIGCLAAAFSALRASEPDLAALEAKVKSVAQQTLPATVALVSEDTNSSGSGVIVSADGLILTAAHVVQGAKEMFVVFPDGEQITGKVLGANYSKDIAMVRAKVKGPFPFVKLGESKPLRAGDWLVALGHSTGFDATRTPPVRFGRVISRGPGNFLTTDCTLIGGDSGGPLFDLDGKLVGIHSSIGKDRENNNHAGIDGFKDDWKPLLDGKSWGALTLNPFANPEMPVLGIAMGMRPEMKGVMVDGVVDGSPAATAGLKIGDMIIALDGSKIDDGGELLQMLAKREAGDHVKLDVLRDEKTHSATVRLMRRNEIFESP